MSAYHYLIPLQDCCSCYYVKDILVNFNRVLFCFEHPCHSFLAAFVSSLVFFPVHFETELMQSTHNNAAVESSAADVHWRAQNDRSPCPRPPAPPTPVCSLVPPGFDAVVVPFNGTAPGQLMLDKSQDDDGDIRISPGQAEHCRTASLAPTVGHHQLLKQ